MKRPDVKPLTKVKTILIVIVIGFICSAGYYAYSSQNKTDTQSAQQKTTTDNTEQLGPKKSASDSACNEAAAEKARNDNQAFKTKNLEEGNKNLADLKARYDAGELTEDEYNQQYRSMNFTINKVDHYADETLEQELAKLGCA